MRRSLQRFVVFVLTMAALVAASTLASAQTLSGTLVGVFRGEGTDSAVGIIDLGAGKMVATIPVGPDAHNIAVSDDGKLAFVPNTNHHGKRVPEGDSLSVIDLAARKEIHRIEVGDGSRPNDVKVSGGKAYFTQQGYKTIGRYDPVRNKVEYFGVGQGGPHMLAVNKDGSMIWAANTNTFNVALLEGAQLGPLGNKMPPAPFGYPYNFNATLWNITLIPLGNTTPEAIEISPDGKEVWTANSGKESGSKGGDLSIIDVATKKAQTLDLNTKHANRMRFSPDGRLALVLERAQTADLLVVDTATHKVAKRIDFKGSTQGESASVGNLAVSPDSAWVFVTVNPKGAHPHVAVIDLKTLTLVRRIELDTTMNIDGLAWAGPK